jgi:hypothetical protein
LRFFGPRLRAAAVSVLAAVTLITLQPSTPVAQAAEPNGPSAAAEVIAEARSHLGARYRWAAEGPTYFDCTGLVLRSFADAGLVKKVGGWNSRSAYAMYQYFRRNGLTSRTGRPGDIVIWGGGSHAGIYLGNGLAISALREGVRIHRVNAVTARFTAFGRTNLSGATAAKAKTTKAKTTKAKTTKAKTTKANTTTATTKPSATKANAAPKAGAARTSTPANNPRVRHAVTTLILRAGAGTSGKELGKIARNAPLAVKTSRKDSQGRTWYEISTAGGRTGWVAGWLTRN